MSNPTSGDTPTNVDTQSEMAPALVPTPAAQPPSVPVPVPSAADPAPRRKSAKPKRGGKAEPALGEMAKADVLAWVRETEAVLDVDSLRIDHKVEMGQIRPLKEADVEELLRSMRTNPPLSRLNVTVWEWEMNESGQGVCYVWCPSHA